MFIDVLRFKARLNSFLSFCFSAWRIWRRCNSKLLGAPWGFLGGWGPDLACLTEKPITYLWQHIRTNMNIYLLVRLPSQKVSRPLFPVVLPTHGTRQNISRSLIRSVLNTGLNLWWCTSNSEPSKDLYSVVPRFTIVFHLGPPPVFSLEPELMFGRNSFKVRRPCFPSFVRIIFSCQWHSYRLYLGESS